VVRPPRWLRDADVGPGSGRSVDRALIHIGMTDFKTLVRRLVDEVMNGNDLDLLDELCVPRLAPKLRQAFSQFRVPDWHQEIRELVAEDDPVVARFRCTGTHHGEWQGLAATGRQMRIDEVYFVRVDGGRLAGLWGLENTWTRMQQLAGSEATLGELGSLSPPDAHVAPRLPMTTVAGGQSRHPIETGQTTSQCAL
jgi:predicted ester cyclase